LKALDIAPREKITERRENKWQGSGKYGLGNRVLEKLTITFTYADGAGVLAGGLGLAR